jgi:hypothetical protein
MQSLDPSTLIAKILLHLNLWPAPARSPPVTGYPLPSSRQWVVAT